MSYIDIDPQESNFNTLNGDFNLVDREVDIASDIILSAPGHFKYAPTVGGSANSYLNSTSAGAVIKRAFVVALKAAGFSKPIVDISSFPDVVFINNDQPLK